MVLTLVLLLIHYPYRLKTRCFDASQRFEFILKMCETTKLNIEKMNEKY
jgi:hypothetical protein